jgi:hypothetical protein
MKQEIKDKIVEEGILTLEELDRAPDWAKKFAVALLKISLDEDFCSNYVTKFEIDKFLEDLAETQDLTEMEDCDKVSANFEERMQNFKFGIPNKIIPYLRQIAIPDIKESLLNNSNDQDY